MEKTGMNKRFVVNGTHDWTKPWHGIEDEAFNFLSHTMIKEDVLATHIYWAYLINKVVFTGNTFRFTYEKFHRRGWLDSEINSAIETLMKYGFLVKVDNNTALFYENGNEALIASMIKESA